VQNKLLSHSISSYTCVIDYFVILEGFQEGSDMHAKYKWIFYITLKPKKKKTAPSIVRDYSPISLLNTSVKMLAKLLANRIQRVITKLVHKNQYVSIKERSIQDCLACSFEYLFLCKKKTRKK
jgi:hypothetical protein